MVHLSFEDQSAFHVGYLNWDGDQTAVTDCVLARKKVSKKRAGGNSENYWYWRIKIL